MFYFYIGSVNNAIKPYVGADMGPYTFGYTTTSTSGDYSASTSPGSTQFGIAPVLGIECHAYKKIAFEANLKYNSVSWAAVDNGTGSKRPANYVGINFGIVYSFDKMQSANNE
jgi:outer membrane protein W